MYLDNTGSRHKSFDIHEALNIKLPFRMTKPPTMYWKAVMPTPVDKNSYRHIAAHWPIRNNIYNLDYLKLDSSAVFSIKWQPKDWKSIKTYKKLTIIKTRLPILVEGRLLSTEYQKKCVCSSYQKGWIISVERVDKDEAVRLYGKKGKRGILRVTIEYPEYILDVLESLPKYKKQKK